MSIVSRVVVSSVKSSFVVVVVRASSSSSSSSNNPIRTQHSFVNRNTRTHDSLSESTRETSSRKKGCGGWSPKKRKRMWNTTFVVVVLVSLFFLCRGGGSNCDAKQMCVCRGKEARSTDGLVSRKSINTSILSINFQDALFLNNTLFLSFSLVTRACI